MVSSPPSLPLAKGSLPMSSKQFHISTGLVVACAFGGVFLLLVLGLLFICCKDKRRRNHITQEHYNTSKILAPTGKDLKLAHQYFAISPFSSLKLIFRINRNAKNSRYSQFIA
jgi:hypothetical protein